MPDFAKQIDDLKAEVAALTEIVVELRIAVGVAANERANVVEDVGELKTDRKAEMSRGAQLAIGTGAPLGVGGALYTIWRLLLGG